MALETLKEKWQIGNYSIIREKPQDVSWDDFDNKIRKNFPIFITDNLNQISFKIQNGPVKEVGINGCQVDTIIECAKIMIEGLNFQSPCRENALAITKLEEALHWLDHRKKRREVEGTEGYSCENSNQKI